jgi:phosphatidylglycerophosphate synthase
MAESYRYDLVERSLTQRWLTAHVWEPIAGLLPARLRPNVITVIGAGCMMLSLVFVKLATSGSRWAYLGAALCTLLYFVADNVDGPHARRTGQTSRLGEFLDHWLDSLNGAVLTLGAAVCLGLGDRMLVLVAAAVSVTYFATIWEQRHTGTFHSDRFGSNEGILVGIGLYLLLFAFPRAPWLGYVPGGISVALGVACLAIGCSLLTLVRVLRRCRGRLADFLPLLLAIVASAALAISGMLTAEVAVVLILAANVAFSGALLIARLARLRSRLRGPLVGGAAVLLLVLAVLWPVGLGGMLASRSFAATATTLVCLVIVYDLVRVTRSFRRRST